MELKEAIEEAKKGIGNQCTHYHEECLSLVLSAAEKWDAIEWVGNLPYDKSLTKESYYYIKVVVINHMDELLAEYRKAQEGK